jgi:hypothetical protein
MTLDDVMLIANKLGGVSFATLLLMILYGSKVRIWRWGSDFTDQAAQAEADKKALRDDRDWWRSIAVRATGLAEAQGEHLLRVTSGGQSSSSST